MDYWVNFAAKGNAGREEKQVKMKRTFFFIPIVILPGMLFCILSCNTKAQSGQSTKKEKYLTSYHRHDAQKESFNELSSTVAQSQAVWPCFHGADFQNKSLETGLLSSWPTYGPGLLWSISGLGEGYASVSIADGLIYTSGSIEDQTFVFAYDLDGELVWKRSNGSSWDVEVYWAEGYDGSRSTPTYDSGMVYHLSEAGRLAAYYAKNGSEIWSRNLMEDFAAEMPDYGFTESVRVDGKKLFVRPAGRRGFQVCLNKITGETIWTNNNITGTYAYNSGVITEYGGYRQLIGASSDCYYSVDTETGKLLWKVDFENPYKVNCTDAVVVNEFVFLSSGEGGGCVLVRLDFSDGKIKANRVWETGLMDNYHGGVIYHDGYFYGSGDKNRGWFSIDMHTGKQMWKLSGRMGSLTFADGMLYLYDEKGYMSLVKATPEKLEKTGEFKVPKGGSGPYWAHPVVCGGRLYLRHSDKLFAYDITSRSPL